MKVFNFEYSDREIILSRLSSQYKDEWDFKVAFPNGTLVYVYKLDISYSKEEIITFVAKSYAVYIHRLIYAAKYPEDKRIDVNRMHSVVSGSNLLNMETIATKHITFNNNSSMIF